MTQQNCDLPVRSFLPSVVPTISNICVKCRAPHGTSSYQIAIRDWSEDGARIAIRGAPIIPRQFYLLNLTARTVHDATVVWNDGRQLGLYFAASYPIDGNVAPQLAFLKHFAI